MKDKKDTLASGIEDPASRNLGRKGMPHSSSNQDSCRMCTQGRMGRMGIWGTSQEDTTV